MNWQPSTKEPGVVFDADDQSRPNHNEYYGGLCIAESIQPSHRPLIAAAPDTRKALLALLAEVDARCGGYCTGTSPLAMAAESARAALAKGSVPQ